MRGPAGTGRGGVSMAGGREGQGARKVNAGDEGPSLDITAIMMFCSEFAYVFRLSVSIRKIARLANIRAEYSFTRILIHFIFISFYLFSCKTHI